MSGKITMVFFAAFIVWQFAFAEEGGVLPEEQNVDHWGLSRHDAKMQFAAKQAAYLKDNPGVAFALGFETPNEKIFRDKLWFKGALTREISLSCAGREAESFQLCIIPLEDKTIRNVCLKVKGFQFDGKGADADLVKVRLWRVGYVRTSPPSYPTVHVGWWPDPLVPIDGPFDIPSPQAAVVWVRMDVSEQAKPGMYRGLIDVVTDSGSQEFEIKLKVRKFSLPKEHVLPFLAYFEDLGIYANYYGLKDREEKMAMYLKYTKVMMTDYKLGPVNFPIFFYDKNDKNFARFDELMQPVMNMGVVCFRIPPALKGEELKTFCDHLREKGWLKYATIYTPPPMDEPAESDYPKIRERFKEVHQIVPDLKCVADESPHPGLAGYANVYWSDVSTEDRAYNRERAAAGDEIWWYFCRIPANIDHLYRPMWDAPLMVIDRSAMEPRIIPWLAFKYDIKGIFVWGGSMWNNTGKTIWPNEPWDAYNRDYSYQVGIAGADNGNGYLVYPGKDGPLPSIRLEVFREGREDYEYLWLLKKLCGSKPSEDIRKLLLIEPSVCVTPHMFTRDPNVILEEREKIALAIEQLIK